MIGIVDYGMGNLHSVRNALDRLGLPNRICAEPEEIKQAERLILPGVGGFRDCARSLEERGLAQALDDAVNREGKPILGICLGLQVMARTSEEGGAQRGLGWLDADVVRIDGADRSLRVPHVGWDQIDCRQESPLFAGVPDSAEVYFVHSYHVACREAAEVDATCSYGTLLVAAVRKGNIAGTQFHPEKSQEIGLRVLGNFVRWKP